MAGLQTLFGLCLYLLIRGILSQSFLKDLSTEFGKRRPTYCYVVLISQNASQDSFDFDLQDLGYPSYIFDARTNETTANDLRDASKTCKNHIFILR